MTRMVLSIVLVAATAAAAPPTRGYIRVPSLPTTTPTMSTGGTLNVSSRKVYMNRCYGGCQVTQGPDNSRTFTSSIADGTRYIPEFSRGDQVWADMMQCVRETFAPFQIEIVDVQPPSTESYFMNIVGGKGTDLRTDLTNAGGVAPFNCGEIPNAITYTFDVYGPEPLQLCWTAAQEVAHAFGLDHEFLAKDPMTYIDGNLPKRFRDEDADCGTLSRMSCACGSTKQNSYRHIVGLFGPGAPTAPDLMVKYPTETKKTQPGFTAVARALDDVRVEKVELYIDGALVTTQMTPIGDDFELDTPRELPQGPHSMEVKAVDVQGTPQSVTLNFEQGPPCTADNGCSNPDVCVQGICIPGPEAPGGLGSICNADTECLSHRCIDGGEAVKHCVEDCTIGNNETCPNDFVCADAGATGVCWPDPNAGCCETGTGPTGPMLLGLGVCALVLRGRRRRPRARS